MQTQLSRVAGIALILTAALTGSQRAQAQDTNFYNTFTYQGRLATDFGPGWDDSPHTWDFLISVISPPAPCYGTDCGWFTNCNACVTTVLGTNSVIVNKGLFTTPINMPTGMLQNVNGLYLQLAVRTNGGGAFTTLWPAQRITATPFASVAQSVSGPIAASNLTGQMPTGMLAGIFSSPLILSNPGNVIAGDGSLLANVNATTIGGTNPCDLTCYWRIAGNIGTTPGNFLGTVDDQPLTLKVHGQTVMRYVPRTGLPNGANLIGGDSVNTISGSAGSVICGGGAVGLANIIGNDHSAIVGGFANVIQGRESFIGGGEANTIRDVTGTNTHWAVIGGGSNNVIANTDFAVIGGGGNNLASGPYSTISGGGLNTISTKLWYETIAGGFNNYIGPRTAIPSVNYTAYSSMNVIGGGSDNTIEAFPISFFTGYGGNTIAGGQGNGVKSNLSGATIAGGTVNLVNSDATVIGGGGQNSISSNSSYAGIVGGKYNVISENSSYATIGGGSNNVAAGLSSTVAGGQHNLASGQYATSTGGKDNQATGIGSMVGGGLNNFGTAQYATISGGSNNLIQASSPLSTIGGGQGNVIQSSSDRSTIAGGFGNSLAGSGSAIGGGLGNTLLVASRQSVIAGGLGNLISDSWWATLAGGSSNAITSASDYSELGGGQYNFIGRRILDLIEFGFQTNHAYAAVLNGGVNNTNIGFYSTLGGGQNNFIVGPANNIEASHAVIAGGLHNQISAQNAGTIGGGRDNVVNGDSDYAVVPGGRSASPNNYGQFAFAAGHMDSAGDAQASTFVLRRKFSGNGDLFLNGDTSDARVLIPPGAVWTLHFQISAVSVTGTNFGSYEVSGVIAKIGATTTFQMMDGSGAVVGTARPIYETPGAVPWLATPYLNADNSLRVAVFAGEAVKWSARIDVAEVRR